MSETKHKLSPGPRLSFRRPDLGRVGRRFRAGLGWVRKAIVTLVVFGVGVAILAAGCVALSVVLALPALAVWAEVGHPRGFTFPQVVLLNLSLLVWILFAAGVARIGWETGRKYLP
jgi:hypothetical protein